MSALRREEKPAAVEERGGAVTRRPNSRLGDSKSSNIFIYLLLVSEGLDEGMQSFYGIDAVFNTLSHWLFQR